MLGPGGMAVLAALLLGLAPDVNVELELGGGFAHPLSAVYRRRTLVQVEALLAADRLRPAFLFEAVSTRRVQPAEMAAVDPQLLTLRNLNTPQDYADALAIAGLG